MTTSSAQAACQQARDASNDVATTRASSHLPSPFVTVQTKAANAKQLKRSKLSSCFGACFGKNRQTVPWSFEDEFMPRRHSLQQSVDWVVGVLDGDPALQQLTKSCSSTCLLPHQLSAGTAKLRACSSENWFDALSTFGSLDLEKSIKLDDFLQQQSSQQLTQAQQQSNQGPILLLQRSSLQPPPLKQALSLKRNMPATSWPRPPLLFCPPGMQFVPVPTPTGFAGYWDQDKERSTPHPLPSDVLARTSFIVQRVHQSISGTLIEETDKDLKLDATLGFMPPGLKGYTEFYTKQGPEESSWGMRRDLRPGRSFGCMYFTADGMLILRHRTRGLFGREDDYIFEDYIYLEENGNVLVDKMCMLQVATGKTSFQTLVAKRRH